MHACTQEGRKETPRDMKSLRTREGHAKDGRMSLGSSGTTFRVCGGIDGQGRGRASLKPLIIMVSTVSPRGSRIHFRCCRPDRSERCGGPPVQRLVGMHHGRKRRMLLLELMSMMTTVMLMHLPLLIGWRLHNGNRFKGIGCQIQHWGSDRLFGTNIRTNTIAIGIAISKGLKERGIEIGLFRRSSC